MRWHNIWPLFLLTVVGALKAVEAGDGMRKLQAFCEFHITSQQGAAHSVSVAKNIPFLPPLAQCALPASPGIGNKLKWIRSTLTTSPFHLRTLGPVSFLPYWAMIGWSHWPQSVINHCRLQVPQVFSPSLLISLSRATAVMDITVGMFFIPSGAGNGLGPPLHSGIETKANVKKCAGSKAATGEGQSNRSFRGCMCCDTSGNNDLCEEGCFSVCAVWERLSCSKVCSIRVFYCTPQYSERLWWRGAFIRFNQERGPFCPTECSICSSTALLWIINSLDSRWSCLYG